MVGLDGLDQSPIKAAENENFAVAASSCCLMHVIISPGTGISWMHSRDSASQTQIFESPPDQTQPGSIAHTA